MSEFCNCHLWKYTQKFCLATIAPCTLDKNEYPKARATTDLPLGWRQWHNPPAPSFPHSSVPGQQQRFTVQASTSTLTSQHSAAPFLAGTCPQSLQGASCQAGWAAEESGGTAERNHQPFHLVLGESWLSRAVRRSRTDSCIIQTFFAEYLPRTMGAAFLKPSGFPVWCLGDANLFIYFSPG